MARVFHIVRRVLLGLVVLLILLVGAAVLFARTERAKSWLREEARAALQEQLGLDATFRDAEIEVLPPRGHVLDVVVEGADGEPLLTAERVTVGLTPAALLEGRLELDEISIEEPRVRLVIEGGRIANLPAIRRPETADEGRVEAPSDVGVVAGAVEVRWVDAPGGPLVAELRDANLDLNRDPRNGDTEVRLLVAGGGVEQGETRLPLRLLQGRVMLQTEERRALVRDLRVSLGDVRAAVPSASVATTAPFDAEGQAELSAPLELVRRLPVSAPPLAGGLHVSGRVSRIGGRIEASGELAVSDLVVGPEFIGENRERTWGPHAVGDVAASFSVTPERVTVGELTVDRSREDDGRVTARDLTIDLTEPDLPIDAVATLDDVELAYILIDAGLYASRVVGRIDGTTTLHGTLLHGLRLRCLPLDLRVRDFRVLTESVTKPDGSVVLAIRESTVRGRVVIDPERVRLRNLAIAFGRSQLGVHADLGVRGPDQEFDLTAQSLGGSFDLEDIGTIAGLEMRGTGPIRARIRGRYPDPSLEGAVELGDFGIGTVELGDVRGPVAWRRTTLSLPDTVGARGESQYRFEGGRIEFGRGGVALDGVAHLEPLHVTDFLDMFAIENAALRRARATVTGEARVAFTSRRNRWTVDLEGSATDVAYGPENLGEGEVDLTYDGGDITVRHAVVRDGEGQVSASGLIGRDGDLDLGVSILGYPIQRIESRPAALESLEGRLRGEARIRGRPDALGGGGWVELSPVVYGGRRLGPSRLLFTMDAGTIRAQGGLAGRAVRVDEATLALAEGYPLHVRGSIHGLDVGALVGPDRLPEGMTVTLDGTVDGGVEFRRRLRFEGGARVESLRVHHPAFDVRTAEPVDLAFDRRRVNIRTSLFEVSSSALEGSTTFTLGGQVTTTDLDLQVRGSLDLGFVPALLDQVEEMQGTLSVDCEIGGPFAEPSLAGQAELRISRMALSGVPYPAEDILGRLRFNEHAVLLEELRARLLGGRASATGRLSVEGLGLGAYRLDLTVRDASLPVGPRSSAVANAAISITSPRAEGDLPLVGGRVELVRFRYEEPIYLDADLGGLARERIDEVRTFDPAGDRIRIDLELVGGGSIQVDNNLAQATAIIDDSVRPFRLVGTNQSWSLLGRLVVDRRGTVSFRDTEFEIERGILEFEDPFDLNPRLDFVASATRRDWLITLQVGGTRRDPIILFRSDPPLSEEDIALLLTVGLTRDETEQLGYGGAAMSAAPEILSQLTGLDRELNRLVPVLDEVRITTDYSPRTGRPEPRVRIGRRVTDAVRIGASAGLSERRDFEANVEWEITDSLSLEGVYENETDFGWGNLGGDLRWRIEF